MVIEGDWVLVFHSIHRVMKAEMVLKQARVPMTLIPVPRQLTADCGLAIRLDGETLSTALAVLADADLSPAERHQLRDGVYVAVDTV